METSITTSGSRARASNVLAVLPLAVFPALVLAGWPGSLPAWLKMWGLAVAIFGSCKWLTWFQADLRGVSIGRSLAYLVAWPGMNADEFLHGSVTPVERPGAVEWIKAIGKAVFGAALVWVGVRLVPVEDELIRGWVGMVGIVFLLHFGGFHVLSCAWRAAGWRAVPLMDWPLRTTGVSEFWGRRWNRAFRHLTHQFLFRPLTARLGPKAALVIGFAVSGLVHDLVISVPARGGYGGPTLFFLIQAAAIFVERSRVGRRLGLGRGLRGWCFAAAVLLLPAPLLFHGPFVRQIILPFLHAVGAT